jgi:DNA-binding response OmpR family regulator
MRDFAVLLVDCDQEHLAGLSAVLTQSGYSVVPCCGFDAGKQYLRTNTPHALVTSLRLGPFNGLHLVLLARQHAPVPAMVVYSGHDDEGMRGEALLAGASYLEKGTLRSSLLRHLAACCATAGRLERSAGEPAGAALVPMA